MISDIKRFNFKTFLLWGKSAEADNRLFSIVAKNKQDTQVSSAIAVILDW